MRYLGYNNNDVGNKELPYVIEEQVARAIQAASKMVKPQVSYDIFDFTLDEENKRIIFTDNIYFSDEYIFKNLKGADEILLAILTLGDVIENESADCFACKDYLMGMIYDAIGSVALNELKRNFFEMLCKKVCAEKKGITRGFSPGSGRWDIRDQAHIFKLVDTKSIGVTLKESMMMKPVKSLSVVYGIGKNLAIPDSEHECEDCDLINCQFRSVVKKHKITVFYNNQSKNIQASHGENLFKVLTKHGVDINSDCGGSHICGKCKVIIDQNSEMVLDGTERSLLTPEEVGTGVRLACFIKIYEDMNVKILSNTKDAAILTEECTDEDISKVLSPRVKKIAGKLPVPSLYDQRDDYTRLKEHFNIKEAHTSIDILKDLPYILKQGDYSISCIFRKNYILDLQKYNSESNLYGVAMDIGTTTIAAYLFDLQSGKKLGTYSSLNPQKIAGSDIISRINYTITHQNGIEKLNDLIRKELNKIIDFFCQNSKIDASNIYELVAVGNTVIIHLLFGIPCENIANAPYIPAFTSKVEIKASTFGININPEGYIVTLPLVSGYIGADTVASVLASGMAENDEISLLLDIGTNGEIVLGNSEKLLSCSTAAGPAFEGIGISCGIGGVYGAINHVDLEKAPIYTTIGGASPIGICGSGIIDSVSELLKHGFIDATGKLSEECNDKRFILDEKLNIYITQQDIRQVQLAKAAIYAGIKVLAKHMQIDLDKIKSVYLSGAFGNYINIESAATIGLIPPELKTRVTPIGNGAGTGAIMCLLSDDMMTKACLIKEQIEYLELSNSAAFSEEFMNNMYF